MSWPHFKPNFCLICHNPLITQDDFQQWSVQLYTVIIMHNSTSHPLLGSDFAPTVFELQTIRDSEASETMSTESRPMMDLEILRMFLVGN